MRHEQQLTEATDVNGHSLSPLVVAQSVMVTEGEQVRNSSEPQNFQALVNECALDAKRRKRLMRMVWGVLVGSILPLLGLNLYLIPRVPSGHWSTTLPFI